MTPTLTEQFDEALHYALAAHSTQLRKGTAIPYAAHLLSVAALILEAGGDERTAIAGLLHDVVEDQGAHHLDEVRRRFGDDVADAVLECSAEDKSDGLDWEPRKARYIAQMQTASQMALRVSLADKVHNLRSIVTDYRELGDDLLSRFGAPDRERLTWYYDSLLDVYQDRVEELHQPLVRELRRQLGRLRVLMARPSCPGCGAGDVVPVIMGMPDAEAFELAEAGEVELAGCVVGPGSPNWSCRVCGHGWRDIPRDDSTW